MKRSKRLYILLGTLLAVCLVTLGVSKYEVHKEKIRNSEEIILKLPEEEVKTLSWEYESKTLSFHKEESWIYDGDEAFPVNEEKIREQLEQFAQFGVSFVIEDVEDFGQYGLATPVCTIHIGTEQDSYEVTLGDYSKMDSQRYVSVGDGNVYLVQNDPLEYFGVTLSDMIQQDEMPVLDEVTGIRFTGAQTCQITYEEDSSHTYCADDVYFMQQDGESLPLDTARVNSYLDTVSYLNPTDYVTYRVTEEELAEYGLDEPELSVTLDYKVQADDTDKAEASVETFTLHIGRDPKERKAVEKAPEDEEEDEDITAYVRAGESQIIYRITPDEYRKLMDVSYNSLRHQEVLSADFSDIYEVTVSMDGVEYTLTSKKEHGDRIWYYQEEELEIAGFRSALMAMKADSFTQEKPSRKEEIGLNIYLDNENYPNVNIRLYRYDGSYCLAAVDGKPVSLVQRSYAVDLMEAVNAIVLN